MAPKIETLKRLAEKRFVPRARFPRPRLARRCQLLVAQGRRRPAAVDRDAPAQVGVYRAWHSSGDDGGVR